ncbi:MAG TPA: DUF5074 domain-containing protein [Lentimicrobium sp.]|nr:DUF5074 domain-containing protein [Lentimicrobium sp.]
MYKLTKFLGFNFKANSKINSLSFPKQAYIAMACSLVLFASCKKEPHDNDPIIPDPPKSTAVYILNQGSISGNNATVTMYDLEEKTTVPDYFSTQNGRELGDTGYDLLIYGSKAYIITNISSQLEVVDAVTFESIKQVPLFNGTIPSQPSALAATDGKIFISAYNDSVYVMDTTNLELIKSIGVGLDPDALLIANDKLWVSNSGGLSFPNYDSTISIIDPVSLTETGKLTVGTNPFSLQADNYGDIYVITRGNYNDIKMRLKVINASTQMIKRTFDEFEAFNFTIKGDTAYVYHYDFNQSTSSIMLINVKTEEILTTNFITDNTVIKTVYGIAVDPTSNDVYICDANNFEGPGKVFCFTPDGKLKFTVDAGINPVAVRFLVQ